jgi:hypothetical protein
MIGFLALLLVNALLFTAATLLAPKPKFEDATPDDPQGPRSQEGDVIPVAFGTVRLAANVTMFSNIQAVENTEKIKTGLFSSRNVTVGYRYEALMQALLCHGPVDELIDIVWQESKAIGTSGQETSYQNVDTEDGPVYQPVTTTVDYCTPALPLLQAPAPTGSAISIHAPALFGGPKHGGGVAGIMRFYWGLPLQLPDETLQYEFSDGTVGLYGREFTLNYEGICYAIFGVRDEADVARFNFGEFGNIPPLHVIVRRCPNALGLTAEQVNIQGAANLAECCYEALTNMVWGMAIPANQLDLDSFRTAGQQLAAEGLGICLSLTSQQSGDDILTELLRYADGQIQQHPVTGLLELTLNRDDYDVTTLPVVDEDAASSATFSRPSWENLKNEVKVIYTRIVDGVFKQAVTQPVQDIAAQRNFGSVNQETLQYTGIIDPVVANKIAARDLRKMSTPLGQVKGLRIDRRAADFRVGRPFVFSWARYGIAEHVFRVVSVDYGTMSEGTITVDAVEDIFALEHPFYAVPVDLGIEDPTFGNLNPVKVTPIVTSDRTTGYLELILEGGGGHVTAVEFQEQSGQHDPAAWHENAAHDGFKAQVDLDGKHESHISWRVMGHLQNGDIGIMADGEVSYPISSLPAKPLLAYSLDPDTGVVTALVDVDSDTANIKVLAQLSTPPTIVEVRATDPIAVPPGETTVTVPNVITLAANDVGYLAALALDENGNESALAIIPISFADVEVAPSVELIEVVPNPITGRTVNISVRVSARGFFGGRLTVWLNHDFVASPEYLDAPDGHIDTSATPDTFGPTDPFAVPGGGTFLLFRDIAVHASQGKRIFLEFIANGVSSGQKSFFLNGGGGVIGPDGELLPGSLKNAEVFAATIAPVEVYAEPLPDRPAGVVAVNTSQGGKLYRSLGGGSWEPVVNAPDLSGMLTSAQIADAQITTAKFASGIQPVQIVTGTLPATNAGGDVAFRTNDNTLYRWNTASSTWTATVAASLVSGQLTSSQIAAGAILQSNLASNLQAVQISAGLPSTNALGNVLYNTLDGKTYRWNGSVFTAVVPSSDLTGVIFPANLVGAINPTAFAGGIQPVAYGSGLPGSPPGGVITYFNTADGKLYRWVGGTTGWTKAVTAGDLAANTVTAGTIAAAAISAREIQAGAISTDKLAVGFGVGGAALNMDPEFLNPAQWLGASSLSFEAFGGPAGGASRVRATVQAGVSDTRMVPFDPYKSYRVRMYLYGEGTCNSRVYPFIVFYDVHGAQLSPSTPPGPGFWYYGVSAGTILNTAVWTLQEATFGGTGSLSYNNGAFGTEVVPAEAAFMAVGFLLQWPDVGVTPTGSQFAASIRLEEVLPGTLIQDGAISTNKIAANSVTAGKLIVSAPMGAALNLDPHFADPSGWFIGAGVASMDPALANAPAGGRMLVTQAASEVWIYNRARVAYDGRKRYRLHAWIYNDGAAGGVYMRTAAYNSADAAVGEVYAFGGEGFHPPNGVWTEYNVLLDNAGPVGGLGGTAKTFTPYMILNYPGGSAGRYFVQDYRLEEAVPGTLIQDGAISTDKLAANSVVAGKIAADAVTAGTIAAAAISTRELAANAITAEKIAIGFGGMILNTDPTMTSLVNWEIMSGSPGESYTTYTPSGSHSFYSFTETWIVEKKHIPIDYLKTYRATLWVYRADASGSIYPMLRLFRYDGSEIPGNSYWYWGGNIPGGSALAYGSTPGGNGWFKYEGIFSPAGGLSNGPIPSDAVQATIGAIINYAGGGPPPTGYYHFGDIRLEEVLPGALIQDGAITANKLTANSVTAGKLAAGAVTAGTIAAGAVTAGTIAAAAVSTTELAANSVVSSKIAAGQVITSHMSANSITGDRIATNTLNADRIISNTISASQLAANSITAGKIAAGAINSSALIVNGAITGVKISIGALTELTNNLGIIVSGRLNGPSGFYLDLGATGSLPVLHSSHFDLFADGTASFSGSLSAASGTFAGTVTSSSFTTTTANFSGSARFFGTVEIYAGSVGADPPGSLRFYDYSSILRSRIYAYNPDGFNYNSMRVWSSGSIDIMTDAGAISLLPPQLVYLANRTRVNALTDNGTKEAFRVQFQNSDVSLFDWPTAAVGDMGMWLVHHKDDGTYSMKRVTCGGNDSAGGGWRALRVAN